MHHIENSDRGIPNVKKLVRCANHACFETMRTTDGKTDVRRILPNQDGVPTQVGEVKQHSRLGWETRATLAAIGVPVRILAAKGEASGAAGLTPQELKEEAKDFRRSLWDPQSETGPILPRTLARVATVLTRRSSPAVTTR